MAVFCITYAKLTVSLT